MPKGQKNVRKLTKLQQDFSLFYNGNGTETCRKAGYKGSDNVLAQQARINLRHPQILKLIEARERQQPEDTKKKKHIADRGERQGFWTDVMLGDTGGDQYIDKFGDIKTLSAKTTDRLKASELLGRSQADFVERHEHTGKDGKELKIRVVNSWK